jgi:hypothetical protein
LTIKLSAHTIVSLILEKGVFMAQIIINDVTVTLPDVIPNHGNRPDPSALTGTERIITCLKSYLENLNKEGKQFPAQITETLKSGKGNIKINYTGTATPAYADKEIGDERKGHGGHHRFDPRVASYKISIEFVFNSKGYRLFDLDCKYAPASSHDQFEHAALEIHTRKYKENSERANAENKIPLNTFLQETWKKTDHRSDAVSNDYSSDIEKMLMERAIEETKRAKEEIEAQAVKDREAAKQAEQKRAAEEAARKAAEAQAAKDREAAKQAEQKCAAEEAARKAAEVLAAKDREAAEQADRIAEYQKAGERLGQAAILERIRQQQGYEGILASINMQDLEPLRISMNRKDMNDQEFEAFFRAAVSSGKTARTLYLNIKYIESKPSLVFQGEVLTFLGYNDVEAQAPRAVEANDVAIHLQRVEEALVVEVEEPVPPMPSESPLMVFSQGLQPSVAIPPQLRAQPPTSYNGASPR